MFRLPATSVSECPRPPSSRRVPTSAECGIKPTQYPEYSVKLVDERINGGAVKLARSPLKLAIDYSPERQRVPSPSPNPHKPPSTYLKKRAPARLRGRGNSGALVAHFLCVVMGCCCESCCVVRTGVAYRAVEVLKQEGNPVRW
jgi:hypothetical protein